MVLLTVSFLLALLTFAQQPRGRALAFLSCPLTKDPRPTSRTKCEPLFYSSATSAKGYTPVIDVDEDAARDIQTFEEWSYNYGVQRCDGFQLTSDDGMDVYAATSQDLPTGSPVVFVPEHLILSSSKAMVELRTPEMNGAEKVVLSVNAESEMRHYYLMLKVWWDICHFAEQLPCQA